MGEEEAARREAALAATPLLQPNFRSSKVTQSRLDKFRELHNKRLLLKEKTKDKAKSKGNAGRNVKMCLEEVDIKDGKDVSASGVTEDSNISNLKENTCLVEKANPDSKKRRKLHWGHQNSCLYE
ncbi:uncharacterized protein [Elaeis guineensis]|uniref:uncharacterized protein isoform X3 n=1 Tax=Elaeis guineensis var. tenera TaxID=51953 RepID=UPI00057A8020